MSPLHWAADSGHVNIVKMLIEKGAKLNIEDGAVGVSEWDCTTDCSNYSVWRFIQCQAMIVYPTTSYNLYEDRAFDKF